MKYFICVLGMVFVIEGLPYFTYPDRIKSYLRKLTELPRYEAPDPGRRRRPGRPPPRLFRNNVTPRKTPGNIMGKSDSHKTAISGYHNEYHILGCINDLYPSGL